MSPETIQFIQAHRNDDVRSLALQAARHPQVDMTAAVSQIAGWQTARVKLPAWAAVEGIIYPPHLSMEQCSSQLTAEYKIEVVRNLLATEDAKSTENTEGTASERTLASASEQASTSASEQASASVSEQASASASEQTSTAEGPPLSTSRQASASTALSSPPSLPMPPMWSDKKCCAG